MKKTIFALTCLCYVMASTSCAVFSKKEKLGCPGSPQAGQLSNDLKIAKGDKVTQTKYKGGRKIY
jgi:hypothetical protein